MTEENKKKIVLQSEWDRKFIKESWTFPFGSLMSAFSNINQGKGMTTADLMNASRELFNVAMEMTEEALLRSQQGQVSDENNPDVPTD